MCRPIRSKIDIILSLLEAMSLILSRIELPDCGRYLTLSICKHSRFVVRLPNKITSFAVPFTYHNEHEDCEFRCSTYGKIDSKVLSDLRQVFTCEYLEKSPIDLIDFIEELQPGRSELWNLVQKLFLYDCGYLRYDIDSNASRIDEKLHPLYHLDIFHANHSTFKLGLEYSIVESQFIDLLDVRTDCGFVKI